MSAHLSTEGGRLTKKISDKVESDSTAVGQAVEVFAVADWQKSFFQRITELLKCTGVRVLYRINTSKEQYIGNSEECSLN